MCLVQIQFDSKFFSFSAKSPEKVVGKGGNSMQLNKFVVNLSNKIKNHISTKAANLQRQQFQRLTQTGEITRLPDPR